MAKLTVPAGTRFFITAGARVVVNAGWTPAEMTTEAWYDASDTSPTNIVQSGDSVSQLSDKGPNGYHLTQGTAEQQPQTNRTINGLNVIHGAGSDFMTGEHLEYGTFPIPASGDIAIFVVAYPDSVVQQNQSMFSFDASNDFQFDAGNNSAFYGRIKPDGIGSSGYDMNAVDKVGALGIFSVQLDFNGAGQYTGFYNGTEEGTPVSYTAKLSSTQVFRFLGNRGNNYMLDGAIGEMVIVEDVTTATRQKIEGYLAWKWGTKDNLADNHPYKDIPPLKGN